MTLADDKKNIRPEVEKTDAAPIEKLEPTGPAAGTEVPCSFASTIKNKAAKDSKSLTA